MSATPFESISCNSPGLSRVTCAQVQEGTSSKNVLLTCATTDGNIRTYSADDPAGSEPELEKYSSGGVGALVVLPDSSMLIGAQQDMKHCVYYIVDCEATRLCQCEAEITDLAVTPNTAPDYVYVASADFKIKRIHIHNFEVHRAPEAQGHEGPVLRLMVNHAETQMVSSGSDGTLRVWSLPTLELLQTVTVLPKFGSVDEAKAMSQCCWSTDDKFLYVPCYREVSVFRTDTWTVDHSLKADLIDLPLSVSSLSPSGDRLAIGSLNGRILIFDTVSRTLTHSYQSLARSPVCDLAWFTGTLYAADTKGHLLWWNTAAAATVTTPAVSPVKLFKGNAEKEVSPVAGSASIFASPDGSPILSKPKRAIASPPPPPDGDDDAPQTQRRRRLIVSDDEEADEGTDMPAPVVDPVLLSLGEDVAEEGTRDSDIGAVKAAYSFATDPELQGLPPQQPTVIERYHTPPPPPWLPVDPQRLFQPSSMPESYDRRYMRWNNIATVVQYDLDDDRSIDVLFHDVSLHHALKYNNESTNYSMADVSRSAVVLAAAADESVDLPSRVFINHFACWSGAFEHELELKQDVVALALGGDWLALGCADRFVFIVTLSGVQLRVFLAPGTIVTMAASGAELAIAYHTGMGLSDSQSIACSTFSIGDRQHTAPDVDNLTIPLKAKAELSWLGFTNEGTLCFSDTTGILCALNRAVQPRWCPIVDFRQHTKGSSDHMFLIEVSENPAVVRCVHCKASRYPTLLPRPMLLTLPWKIPVCGTELESSLACNILQQSLMVTRLGDERAVGNSTMNKLKKDERSVVFKMFMAACSNGQESRALDTARLMPTSESVQICISYATKQRRLVLAEKLGELAREKQQQAAVQCARQTQARQRESTIMLFEDSVSANSTQEVARTSPVDGQEMEDARVSDMLSELTGREDSSQSSLSASKFRIPMSQQRRNPFKCNNNSSMNESGDAVTRGASVFDEEMAVKAVAKVDTGGKRKRDGGTEKTSKQARLSFAPSPTPTPDVAAKEARLTDETNTTDLNETAASLPKAKRRTAFSLWCEEHSADLDVSFSQREDATQTYQKHAMKQFQTLSTETKKIWTDRAKSAHSGADQMARPDVASFAFDN